MLEAPILSSERALSQIIKRKYATLHTAIISLFREEIALKTVCNAYIQKKDAQYVLPFGQKQLKTLVFGEIIANFLIRSVDVRIRHQSVEYFLK